MSNIARDDGFTIAELLMSMTILLILTSLAVTTFQASLKMNDNAGQLADANQNLRAGVNQVVRDFMQAGRIIGPEGIPIPSGTGATAISRPAPPGRSLTFDVSTTTNLPDITTGSRLGPTISGTQTDMATIMTVDPFMPTINTPPVGAVDANEGTIDPSGSAVSLPSNSLWITGDTTNDTPAIQVGDLVLFKNPRGMAVQTVTGIDATHIYFAANDWFHFNQRSAPQGSIMQIKSTASTTTAWSDQTTLFRVLMITYYVDNTSAPGLPRLMRQINNFAPQVLAGVVEDLGLSYDLVDGVNNPAGIASLPYTDPASAVTYTSNQIRKVNIHIGVRSEQTSRSTSDYIRNHLTTSVDVRSLASVDRYVGT